ncbi:MAG: hypothetical protein H9855_08055 [Candidatus Acinetobacter avistercoris]|uniref:hypothetical protein n=1 Tax=Acinetobacter sp. KS-LM10 TaxID=3120518 RepID=UPI001F9CF9C0|nr:hypothetical protein [Candidatus Acinetobacter avistercoris]
MNEEQILKKIKSNYIAELSGNNLISLIPRNIPLDQFNDLEQSTLQTLMSQYFNLLLKITFRNLKTNLQMELNEDNLEQIINHPSEYSIDSICFNLSSAVIWISIYYDAEVTFLYQENTTQPSIDLSHLFVALFISIITFYLFFNFNESFPEIIRFIILGIGILALGFIFEKLQKLLPKQKKIQETEQKFFVAQYLAHQLEFFATEQFKLDFND